MITVHHLEDSRSQRILWLLEELGVPYEIRHYKRDPKTHLAPPELEAVHPLGKSPVITDGGRTIAESGAIVEYILDKYANGRLQGDDKTKLAYWLHFAEGSAMPPFVMELIFKHIANDGPRLLRPLLKLIAATVKRQFLGPQIKGNLKFIESNLAGTGWLAGKEFSAADVQMSFPLEAAMSFGYEFPLIAAFVARIHARPAYRRAIDRGGPYKLA